MSAAPQHNRRRDLQDLQNLSRLPILSYLQKQAPPRKPRGKAASLVPARYPVLAAFSPKRVVKWGWEYLSHRIGPRHAFLTYAKSDPDQGIYQLEGGDDIRIALAGDWATGTDEAASVAHLIDAFAPHYSIHLGDVYYVGSRHEVDEKFLGIDNPNNGYDPCLWPTGSRASFALNGNHEMYARGFAYFERMLPRLGLRTNGRQQGQKASYFCLENDHWRIVALDTAYGSVGWPFIENMFAQACALRAEQIEWLRTAVRPRADDRRGIILLTHHQYYSRYDDCYPKQAKQLAEFFSRPVLWFWGHEHRMVIYREYGLRGGIRAFGRCIGHGGMPVELPFKTKHRRCPVEFSDRRHYRNDENLHIGYNGFARLTLHGNRLIADYVDVHGAVVFSETWAVADGVLQRTHVKNHVAAD
jgi:calcineurin-like phosphoesterase family protein